LRYVKNFAISLFSLMWESIHHEGGEITPEMVVHALLAAAGEGQRRKRDA
jgi:hypothetical protein